MAEAVVLNPVPCGLRNFGASCYLNSVLQLLASAEDFSNQMTRLDIETIGPELGNSTRDLMRGLKDAIVSMRVNGTRLHAPGQLFRQIYPILPRPRDSTLPSDQIHHDAHECLQRIMNIYEPLCQDGLPFGGTSVNLRRGGGAVTLQGINEFTMFTCRLPNSQRRNLRLEQLISLTLQNRDPENDVVYEAKWRDMKEHLIIHLARLDGLQRNSKTVHYPENMNLNQFYTDSYNRQHTNSNFELTCVIIHSGSLEKGHYRAFVARRLPQSGKHWYLCDDSAVTNVGIQDVLRPSRSSTPYILMYSRTQPENEIRERLSAVKASEGVVVNESQCKEDTRKRKPQPPKKVKENADKCSRNLMSENTARARDQKKGNNVTFGPKSLQSTEDSNSSSNQNVDSQDSPDESRIQSGELSNQKYNLRRAVKRKALPPDQSTDDDCENSCSDYSESDCSESDCSEFSDEDFEPQKTPDSKTVPRAQPSRKIRKGVNLPHLKSMPTLPSCHHVGLESTNPDKIEIVVASSLQTLALTEAVTCNFLLPEHFRENFPEPDTADWKSIQDNVIESLLRMSNGNNYRETCQKYYQCRQCVMLFADYDGCVYHMKREHVPSSLLSESDKKDAFLDGLDDYGQKRRDEYIRESTPVRCAFLAYCYEQGKVTADLKCIGNNRDFLRRGYMCGRGLDLPSLQNINQIPLRFIPDRFLPHINPNYWRINNPSSLTTEQKQFIAEAVHLHAKSSLKKVEGRGKVYIALVIPEEVQTVIETKYGENLKDFLQNTKKHTELPPIIVYAGKCSSEYELSRYHFLESQKDGVIASLLKSGKYNVWLASSISVPKNDGIQSYQEQLETVEIRTIVYTYLWCMKQNSRNRQVRFHCVQQISPQSARNYISQEFFDVMLKDVVDYNGLLFNFDSHESENFPFPMNKNKIVIRADVVDEAEKTEVLKCNSCEIKLATSSQLKNHEPFHIPEREIWTSTETCPTLAQLLSLPLDLSSHFHQRELKRKFFSAVEGENAKSYYAYLLALHPDTKRIKSPTTIEFACYMEKVTRKESSCLYYVGVNSTAPEGHPHHIDQPETSSVAKANLNTFEIFTWQFPDKNSQKKFEAMVILFFKFKQQLGLEKNEISLNRNVPYATIGALMPQTEIMQVLEWACLDLPVVSSSQKWKEVRCVHPEFFNIDINQLQIKLFTERNVSKASLALDDLARETTTSDNANSNSQDESVHARFVCEKCGKTFTTKYWYQQHRVRCVLQTKHFLCNLCDKSFHERRFLKLHIDTVHHGKRFACNMCNFSSVWSGGVYEHVRQEHTREIAVCTFTNCEKIILPQSMKNHLRCVHFKDLKFKCSYCEKRFFTVHKLQCHIVVHTGRYKYQCAIHDCGKGYTTRKNLEYHMLEHENKRAYKCEYENCTRRYNNQHNLNAHIARFHMRRFECTEDDCIFKCWFASDLKVHLERHQKAKEKLNSNLAAAAELPYKCVLCDVGFKDPIDLDKHNCTKKNNCSKTITVKTHKCTYGSCTKTFDCKTKLEAHMTKHTDDRPFKCQICGQAFKLKDSLIAHGKKFHGLRFYKCTYNGCEASFKTKKELDRHIIDIHLDRDKPYKCDTCGNAYSLKDSLRRHVKTAHPKDTDADSHPHKCLYNDCGKSFESKAKLVEHIRSHTGEKPFQCDICKKKYGTKTVYKQHVTFAHNRMVYECTFCDKTYPHESSLMRHLLIHTGERPYECKHCEETFNYRESLKIHERKCTGKNYI